jgi:predicted AAA+ superfamily ATPase
VPERLLGHPRTLVDELRPMLERREVLTLAGVRRGGKTTIAYQLIQRLLDAGVAPGNVLMLNLEDPRYEGVPLGDLLSTYRRGMGPEGRTYIFLDEVQASKDWERWVLVDYEQKKDVGFVVTGSSSSLVRGELATLLTGRTVTFPVRPLSFREFLSFRGVDLSSAIGTDRQDLALHHLEQYLDIGGFPQVALEERGSVRRLLTEYFDTIVYKDVIRPHGVDPDRIIPVARFLMANIGTPQSLRSMRKATGLSVDTLKTYVRYFEEAHLLLPLASLSYTSKPKALEHIPSKYYCIDTGLRNTVVDRFSPDTGWLVENVVFVELLGRGRWLHHWKGEREVDFVEGSVPGPWRPINVSYGPSIPEREVEGFEEVGRSIRGSVGEPLMLTRDRWETSGGVRHLPVWRWLLDEP